MTARAWVPLLRALRAAGWDHKEVSDGFHAIEHVWRRGGPANLQQITWNVSGAKVYVKPYTFETTEVLLGDAEIVLKFVGAFKPAPERIDWRSVRMVTERTTAFGVFS